MTELSRSGVVAIALYFLLSVALPVNGIATTGTPTTTLPGIHVEGAALVNSDGQHVVLHGIDRSGTEYACIQGWGIFDGPNHVNDDGQVPLMRSWGANEVMVGLNEDCWLGINGVPAAYSGANYVRAIVHETKTLERNHLYPVIADFWMAPGATRATSQDPMPDDSHSPRFWHSVAETFKRDPRVILRLKEEPYPDANGDTMAAWECWSKGDVQYGASGSLTPVSRVPHCDESYEAVGMQSLIDIVRGAGARNVIEVPGIQYANALDQFLTPGIRVHDTLSPPQLVADVDVYPDFNACGSVACYDREYLPVLTQMPLVAGEAGVAGCSTSRVNAFLNWMNEHRSGYAAWAWDAWGGCGVLIANYRGTPSRPWGVDYRARLLALRRPSAATSP